MTLPGEIVKDAVFSTGDNRRYRYLLTRRWGAGIGAVTGEIADDHG